MGQKLKVTIRIQAEVHNFFGGNESETIKDVKEFFEQNNSVSMNGTAISLEKISVEVTDKIDVKLSPFK